MKKNHIIKLLASLFILILLISINHKIINENLFNRFYRVDTIQIERGSQDFKYYIDYNNGNYEESSNNLIKIVNNDTTNMKAWYYLAICYIELDKKNEAINIFKKIIYDGDNLYVDKSRWYLGLCYIDIKDYDKSAEQFKILLNGESLKYKEKSKKILRKLNKL